MNWKKLAVIIGIIVVVATITLYFNSNWKDVVNAGLSSIQSYIGLNSHQFQIP